MCVPIRSSCPRELSVGCNRTIQLRSPGLGTHVAFYFKEYVSERSQSEGTNCRMVPALPEKAEVWGQGESCDHRGLGTRREMNRQNKTFRTSDELLCVMLQGWVHVLSHQAKPTGYLQGPRKGCVRVSRQVICKWYIPLLGRIAGGLGTQRPLQQLRSLHWSR